METVIFNQSLKIAMIARPHDIEIRLAPAMYILNKLGNRTNKQKLFKILYFADKDYIARFGRPFSDDRYIAMDNGPVPSILYDYIKVVEGTNKLPIPLEFVEEIGGFLGFEAPYHVISKKNVNLDLLSPAAIKSMDHAIGLYRDKSFGELTQLSHDGAWKAANHNSEISVADIAKDAGANEAMIKYIIESN